MKWNVWRSALAGALIGLVEAAGLAAVRPAPRSPLRVVREVDRFTRPSLRHLGVWFLEPLPAPRPAPSDLRRPLSGVLSILVPGRHARTHRGPTARFPWTEQDEE